MLNRMKIACAVRRHCWKIGISAVKVVAGFECKFVQNCRKFAVNKNIWA